MPLDEPGRRVAATLVALFAVALFLIVLGRAAEVFILLFISSLLGIYLSSLTDLCIRRISMPRGPAIAIAALGSLLALLGVAALILPPVMSQSEELVGFVPELAGRFQGLMSRLVERYPVLQQSQIGADGGRIITILVDDATNWVRESLVPYLTTGGVFLVEMVSVLAMAMYLARDPKTYKEGIVTLVPPKWRHVARRILSDLANTIRAWIGGQLLAMVVLAVLTGIGLWILRVPYALAFGVFTGVVAIVPFFGTIVSTLLPALFVLATGGWVHALAVALLGVGVHLIEANIVAPLIFAERISVPPVLTIVSLLAMASILGVLGLIIAVPLLAAVLVVARHVLIWEIYHDQPPEAGVPPAVLVPTSERKVSVS